MRSHAGFVRLRGVVLGAGALAVEPLHIQQIVQRVGDAWRRGYINEYPVERFYRDVRLLRLYEARRKSSKSSSAAS